MRNTANCSLRSLAAIYDMPLQQNASVRPHRPTYMPQLTLFALDRDTAERLALAPAASALQHDLTLVPHESTTVATAAMLVAHPVPCCGAATSRWKALRGESWAHAG